MLAGTSPRRHDHGGINRASKGGRTATDGCSRAPAAPARSLPASPARCNDATPEVARANVSRCSRIKYRCGKRMMSVITAHERRMHERPNSVEFVASGLFLCMARTSAKSRVRRDDDHAARTGHRSERRHVRHRGPAAPPAAGARSRCGQNLACVRRTAGRGLGSKRNELRELRELCRPRRRKSLLLRACGLQHGE